MFALHKRGDTHFLKHPEWKAAQQQRVSSDVQTWESKTNESNWKILVIFEEQKYALVA